MVEALPIYPAFRLKAELLARQMCMSDRFDQAFLSLVMGGVIRTWLHASQKGVGRDFFVAGLTAEQIDQAVGVRNLAGAMQAKGWLRFVEKKRFGPQKVPVLGAEFPELKLFRKEQKKAAWEEKLNAPGATAKVAWFEDFWAAYVPAEGSNKGSKQEALAEWLKLPHLDDAKAAWITQALAREVKSGWRVCNGKTPHARRYIHGRMWEAAPPPRPIPPPAPGRVQAGPPQGDPPPAGLPSPNPAATRQNADTEPQGPVPSLADKVGLKRGTRTTGPAAQ